MINNLVVASIQQQTLGRKEFLREKQQGYKQFLKNFAITLAHFPI